MKIKTTELTDIQLNWVVAKCEGLDVYIPAFASRPWLQIRNPIGMPIYCPKWSTDWSLGGPIIEREQLQINAAHHNDSCAVEPMAPKYGFKAPVGWHWEAYVLSDASLEDTHHCRGQTPLIAAMRCYVVSKLGDEVEIPEELCQT